MGDGVKSCAGASEGAMLDLAAAPLLRITYLAITVVSRTNQSPAYYASRWLVLARV